LLFRAAADTLQTFARDEKHLGGTIGFVAILHTWSQTLSLHPHLHCVVTGGALAQDGARWVRMRHKGFLFPVRALSKVFRGKFLEGLRRLVEAGDRSLEEPLPELLRTLYQHDWVVDAKPPFAGPESVLRYLGRYTHRIALSNRRIEKLQDGRVAFRYRDRADCDRTKRLELSVYEFIRRFLLHARPQGFVRIRHHGLLANRCRKTALARCRALLPAQAPTPSLQNERMAEKLLRLTGTDITQCPACREGHMRTIGELMKHDPRARVIEILDSS
jgi:hypothetical protein